MSVVGGPNPFELVNPHLSPYSKRKYKVKKLTEEIRKRADKRKRGELKTRLGDVPDATDIYGKPIKKNAGKILKLIFKAGVRMLKLGITRKSSSHGDPYVLLCGPRWLFKDDYDEYDDIQVLKGHAITRMRELQEEAEEKGYEFYVQDPDECEFGIQFLTEVDRTLEVKKEDV